MLKRFTRARVIGVSAILAAAGLGGIAAGAPTAGASVTATSPQMAYTCDFPIIGDETVEISITATSPSSVTPGQSFNLTSVQSTSVISGTVTTDLAILESSISGTVTAFDVDATNATPATVNGAATPISFGPDSFTAGDPLTLTLPATPETVGPFVAGSSGTVVLTPGDITLTTTLSGMSYTIPCTPPATLPTGASIDVPISTQMPVGAIGGVGLAGAVGVGLIWRQRRSRMARRASTGENL